MFRTKTHIDPPLTGLVPPGTLLTAEDLKGVDIQRLVDNGALVPIGNTARAMGATKLKESDLLDDIEELHEKLVVLEKENENFVKKQKADASAVSAAEEERDAAATLATGLTAELTETRSRLENALLATTAAQAKIDELEKAVAAHKHHKK